MFPKSKLSCFGIILCMCAPYWMLMFCCSIWFWHLLLRQYLLTVHAHTHTPCISVRVYSANEVCLSQYHISGTSLCAYTRWCSGWCCHIVYIVFAQLVGVFQWNTLKASWRWRWCWKFWIIDLVLHFDMQGTIYLFVISFHVVVVVFHCCTTWMATTTTNRIMW